MSHGVRLLTVLAVALSSALFLSPAALAADAACQPGFDATTYLQEESVNGEVTSLYMVHRENDGVQEEAQTWISKAKGLPVRTEEDVDSGDGDKRHMSIRYEYNHVQAPAGVQ